MKNKISIGLLIGFTFGVVIGVLVILFVFALPKSEQDLNPEKFPSPMLSTIQVASTLVFTPTPIPLLKLNEQVRWKDLIVSVESYEVTNECRGYGDGPSDGAKLVYVWINAKNVGENVIESPSILTELSDIDKHSGWYGGTVCLYDDEAFGNDCWKDHGELYPGVMCRGWELFEVPENMRVDEKSVKLSMAISQEGIFEIGIWDLEGK